MAATILSNAELILPDQQMRGAVVIEDGRISGIRPGHGVEGIDLHGQYLAPGIIDLHSDYLEKELAPRPDTHFPIDMAFGLMDMRALASGVTMVLGAARISADRGGPLGSWHGDGLELVRQYERLAQTAKIRHRVHIRWDPNFEPSEDSIAEVLKYEEIIGNLVYNESIPGERQYRNTFEDQVRKHAIAQGLSFEESMAKYQERARIARTMNNRPKVNAAVGGRIPLGSHDDTTIEHVIEAHEQGCSMAEMPVTFEAAQKAKDLGMQVCMGAPNYYRGGSHCGNLSCREAMAHGLVDMLCSDYHFPALLASAMKMVAEGMPSHEAFRFVTLHPAEHLGLSDELGSIEIGKRADLIAFGNEGSGGLISQAWVDGEEVLHTKNRASVLAAQLL